MARRCATAQGVRRADPRAKVGGPALASGPFENSDYGHCQHGKGFTRGLMLWCQQEKLPLDFVSWHEYFQMPETIVKEADAFRACLADFPELQRTVSSFMITEWMQQNRLAIVLVNFRDRYALRRQVQVRISQLPAALKGGRWQEWIGDATHSNVWNDQNQAELAVNQTGELSGNSFTLGATLAANSVTLIELLSK
jgi:hypothetical protein